MWAQFRPPALIQTGNKHVRFPLKRTVCRLHVSSCLARLHVTQHYHNKSSLPIECSYKVKLLPEVLIRSMTAVIAGKTLKFTLKAIEEAKETYSDAIAEGRTAVCVSRDKEDQLILAIGLFPGDSDVVISLKVAYPMDYRQGRWMCVVPSAFFPVKKPGKPPTDDQSDPFDIAISESSVILSVSSPSHSIKSTITGASAAVQLMVSRSIDTDFCLEYTLSTEFQSNCLVSQHPGLSEYIALLAFRSTFRQHANVIGEYVFVLDRSGSMSGQKITMMKEAMVFLLKSLPVECKFNVVSFGSEFKILFERSKTYGDETVAEALKAVKEFQADMGGTDLLPALTAILSISPEDQYPRNVILLTDGCVENGNAVLSLLKEHKKVTRFHAIGLGNDVSEKWLRSVSLLTHGGHELIHKPKLLSERLVKVLERILTPSMTAVEVNWPGGESVQTPANNSLRNIYEGDVLYVYSNYGPTQPTGEVTVSYWDTVLKSRQSIPVAITPVPPGKLLSRFWAKSRLSDLESDPSSPQSSISDLSLKYSVLSSATAYIGVSAETVTTDLPMVVMQRGSDLGLPRSTHYKARKRTSRGLDRIIGSLGRRPDRGRGYFAMSLATDGSFAPPMRRCIARSDKRSRSRSPRREEHQQGSLQWVIEAQSSAGFWSISTISPILKSLTPPVSLLSTSDPDTVWATLQVLFLLLTRFQQDADKAILIVRKAKRWLEERGVEYEQHIDSIRLLGY